MVVSEARSLMIHRLGPKAAKRRLLYLQEHWLSVFRNVMSHGLLMAAWAHKQCQTAHHSGALTGSKRRTGRRAAPLRHDITCVHGIKLTVPASACMAL